jgi:hypothetical protein
MQTVPLYFLRRLCVEGSWPEWPHKAGVQLTPVAADMQQVVVTALGIKKEAKSLGYSTSMVPSEQVTVNRTTNFMNALSG